MVLDQGWRHKDVQCLLLASIRSILACFPKLNPFKGLHKRSIAVGLHKKQQS